MHHKAYLADELGRVFSRRAERLEQEAQQHAQGIGWELARPAKELDVPVHEHAVAAAGPMIERRGFSVAGASITS